MDKILEKLYLSLADEYVENNPFETPEINKKRDNFFNTYFSTSIMTFQEYNTAEDKFIAFAIAVEANAFEVGFNTAIQLLMGGSAI